MEEQEEFGYQEEYPIASEALIRIEKAKLYQLLLQNDLFGDDAGDPEAVEQVTEEIKAFVLAQLETLIGMRNGNEMLVTQAKLPWNAQQIAVLTQLADRVLLKESSPIIPTPVKPSVNTINRNEPVQQPIKQSVQQPVQQPKKRPRQNTNVGKPIIGNNKQSLTTPLSPPMTVKPGDERAYSKPIDNPLRKPMPSAMEMQSHALMQVTQNMDFVSHGSSQDPLADAVAAKKVGNLLLGGMAAQIETIQQGID